MCQAHESCSRYYSSITTSTISMAKSKNLTSIFTVILNLTLLFSFATAKSPRFYRGISPTSLALQKEKLSHLHFYFHDIVSGPKPTAVRVAEAHVTNTSSTLFGLIVMADDPLTAGPEPGSRLVGKAQGIYGSAAQDETGLLMVMNFAFTEGKYNGSTLSLLGRNTVFSAVREMPIVGGSGAFRFARGYAQAKTHTFDIKTGDAVVEYNVYVFHY
ncbi:Dirigent protein 21 [Spatholobus suberectus]|nr:Dirigent protein 21 [Spatholobus suberectus]